MKLKIYSLLTVLLLFSSSVVAQNLKPFVPRFDQDLKGDILLIGNNTINRSSSSNGPNVPYNGTGQNGSINMGYVDVDSDASTFSSSSADLTIPPTSASCYRIRYAGLYWAGILQSNTRTGIDQVKLKLPGSSTYTDITGTIVHDDPNAPIGTDQNKVYACYYDITSLVTGLANPQGTYTVANVMSSTGSNGGTGLSAGWSIFIVYEDPLLPAKSIVSFDGFSGIGGATTLDIPITGFRTIPAGPVRAKFAFSCLEGDYDITGDYLRINGNTISTATGTRPRTTTNFFNSTITDVNGIAAARNPASDNTLGYDAGIITNFNPANSVLGNNATSATIRLGSTQDVYFYFFNAFAVDIIEPQIVLTKTVEDSAGNPIADGSAVNLGQYLTYVIGFQNIGNDDATNVTIRDILPVNIIYNHPTDLVLPAGVTVASYNAGTREIIFNVNPSIVNVGDPRSEIRIRVRVVENCYELVDACENRIINQAFASYQGVINTTPITDDPSLSTFTACNLGTPSPTNFIGNIDDCVFSQNVILCGNSVQLTAPNGYTTYTWSGPGPVTPAGGQVVTVTQPGTYTVLCNAPDPCIDIPITFNVVSYDAGLTNPVLPYADEIVICPNDGDQLPQIYLCGTGDSQTITTNIASATSITWYQLNEPCASGLPATCANENASCTWNTLITSPNFTVTSAGQYKLIIRFPGNCSSVFYFNVFQNLLNPQAVATDIICTTPGCITVNNVPSSGYEFSLSTPAGAATGVWQASNVFCNITVAGNYTVFVRQTGFTNGCLFSVPNIQVRQRNFTVTANVTQPLCFGDRGSITLGINDVNPQYYFELHSGASPAGPLVASAGPQASNTYTFPNLTPGQTYTWVVRTDNGCTQNGTFTINNPVQLVATSALTRPLSCNPGEITINATGGTPPYAYYVNTTPPAGAFQTTNVVTVSTPGTYTTTVVDANNCQAVTTIVVNQVQPPVYTVTSTNILCNGANNGTITFNVTNANGNALQYSINNGTNWSNSNVFTGLGVGTYTAVVQYTTGTAVCITTPQTVTITEPANPLIASGGVAAVACDTNGGNGIVRITNVQGGTPYPGPNFYQYNFGSGYQNSNQANLPPGTYTISVRDANLCEYFMTVTLDPIPAAPTITVSNPSYNCDGTSTSTVTVNNAGSSYTYTYSINPPLVPPHDPNSNVFTNVPCGNPTVTVNYTLVSPPTFSNLLREDFGQGDDTTSPGINTNYCFERQINNAASWCRGSAQINDGDYSVTKRILFPFGAWYNYADHTSNGVNPNGRFLAINIGGVAGVGGILYTKPINDIIPNQDIRVSLWAGNLLRIDPSNTQSPPNLTIQLVRNLGLPTETIIATANTGDIPKSNTWLNYNVSLNPGANTSLSFVIRSNIAVTSGNDVVIDDIEVYQLPVACLTTRTFPLNLPCNQAFSAQIVGHRDISCSGLNDGTITIAAQNYGSVGYQYSMDNGATWSTVQMTSPITVNVPAGYPGHVLVRYASVPPVAACSFTLPQVILTPAPLVATATAGPATCSSNAIVTATAVGGTPAYSYQLTGTTALGAPYTVAYQSSGTFTNVPPGTYTVTVRDANGCTDPTDSTFTITAPASPTLTLNATSDFCYDGTNAATLIVTAANGIAPYEFSINGGAFVTSNTPINQHTFNGLTPGTYTIAVRDAYGCTNSAIFSQTINAQLTINAALTKGFDCTASPNATISVTTAGGYPGYTYQVNINGSGYTAILPAPVGNPFVYSIPTANPGTYQFQVTDTRGCIAQSGVITIPALTLPTATHVATNVTCNGLSNGSVTITPSSGTAPYVISFNGSPFTATTTYSGLAAGTYNYIVRDAKQCTFNGSVTITQPTAISVSAALTTPYTCTTSGVITVTASGGTGVLSYSINGVTFQAGNTFTVTSAGTYTITVRDINGCTATTTVVVTPLTPPTDITFSATAVTCTSSNTSNVTLTVTGGTAPLTYQIIAPVAGTPQASNVFNNLAPGTYTFQVTDSRNCTYQESYTINPLPALTVSAVVNNNIQCVGSATGSIRFTVSGFSPTYNYTITPNGFPGDSGTNVGTASVTVNNLPAGTYTINIVNPTTACTASTTVTISAPSTPLAATLTTSPVTCSANGSVTVNASGGWGGYTYAISPVAGTQSGNTFTNVPAGSYNITIVDANGCSITRPFTLTTPLQPTLTLSATSDFCYDTTNGATLVVTAAGGVAPYEFSINGGAYVPSNTPVNGHTFPNLSPGSYTISVRDAYGCTNAVPFSQTINPQLTLTTVLTKDFDCTASPNAVITGNISGGYPGYTYQVNYNGGGFGAPIPVAGSTITHTVTTANPGTYEIRVTDTRGCVVQSGVITIPPLVPVTVTSTQVNVLCFGEATGSVTFTPGGGVGPYQINFNGGGFTSNFTYSNLPAGTYTYVVRDSKMCTVSGSITITQNTQITYNVTTVPIQCTAGGTVLGQICVQSVSGGVAPYTYTLNDLSNGNPPQTFNAATPGINHCFTNLDYGFYDLTVTDANGCQITNSNIAIASPVSDLDITATVLPPGDCLSGATVVVDAVSTFGTGGPYYFSLYPTSTLPPAGAGWQPEMPAGSGTSTFTGLLTGVTYSFVVWDQSSNCYYYTQADTSTASNSTMTSSINVVNNVTCRGSADANVSVTINNYSGTSVSWTVYNSVTLAPVAGPTNVVGLPGGAFTINNIGPLAPGSYFVLLTETSGVHNGCSVSTPVFNVVESLTPLSIVASVIKNDNCNLNAGVITVTGQGGTSPYTYSIDGVTFGASNTFNVESGTYPTVSVRDANGCIVSTSVTVNLDPTPNIDVTLISACAAQGNYSLNVTLNTVGVAPYSLSLDGGAFQTVTFPYMINGLSSGAHTVEVRDVNGCGETVNITILTPLSGASAITALPTCANNDGVIVVTPSGGSGTYTYSISPAAGTISGANPATISGLPAGSYTVTITDATTLCTFNIPVTLGAPTPVTFTASSTMVSCNGGSDGTITVTLNAGNNNPVYTYQIIAPIVVAPQTSNVFTGLPVGTYTVQVNSGRGCSSQQNVVVNEPTVVTASASATAFTCAPNNSENTSTITIVGGGGTTPYTYSIDGTNYFTGNTFQIVNTNVNQTFTVYVKDNNGCIGTNTVTINRLPRLVSATINQVTAITCTNPEVVNVAVVGGSGTFTYQLLPSGTPQASSTFNLPAPGTYTIHVVDVTTGCYIDATYTVNPFNNLDVTGTLVNGVSCLGGTNGSISINVTGYSGAYNYTVFNSVGAPVAGGAGNTTTNPFTIPTGLPAGNYTVQITETASPFCQDVTGVINVTTPATAVGINLVSNINANCTANAQVTVIGTGGTPGYTYAFMQNGVAPTPADFTASNTAALNPATNTQWDVWVQDVNGCRAMLDVTIVMDPMPTVNAPTLAADQCTSTGASYTFTVTGTGVAPLTYSIGGAFQSSPTFTVVASATPYTVTVRDANGCTATDTITIYPALGVTTSITALPTCANNDGTITINASGGSGTYSYSISPVAGIIAGNVISGLPAGTYTITVTDTTTLCTTNTTVTLGAPTPVTFTLASTPVSCFGGNDGTITVTLNAGNDNPVYTYQIIAGPSTTPVQNTNVFTGLVAGNYTVQVNSGRACSATLNVTVNEPAPVNVPAPTVVNFNCNANTNNVNFATITVNSVTGGTGVYNIYEFIQGATVLQSSSSNVYNVSNLAGGTYTINVYDSNGCLGSTTVNVIPYVSISEPNITVVTPITCTNPETIQVSVTSTGGTPSSLIYTINSIPAGFTQTNATGLFTGLTIGDYMITVTNPDTNCSSQKIHYVFDPNSFDIQANVTSHITCFGGNNGSVTVQFVDNNLVPTNDAGAFNYVLVNNTTSVSTPGSSPSAGPLVINNLNAGTDTLTATLINSPYCPASISFTVDQPTAALDLNLSSAPITCIAGNNDGSITAIATGGWNGQYEYQLQLGATVVVPYGTNSVFNNLTQGSYTVYVRDVRGCVHSENIILTNPTAITANAIATQTVNCFGDQNMSITVTGATGGQGSNYTYTLNTLTPVVASSGPQSSNIFNNLGAGTYEVIIHDGWSCASNPIPVTILPRTQVQATVAMVANSQQCADSSASLTITATGGVAPYSYSTSASGPFAGSFNPSITLTNVPVGTYSYYVQDANGCISFVSNEVKIDQLEPLTLNVLSSTDSVINCFGGNDASIHVMASGGIGGYQYTLTGPGGTVGPQANGDFPNLIAGNYVVSVTSGNCTPVTVNINVTEPTQPFNAVFTPSDARCFGEPTGTITMTFSGYRGTVQFNIRQQGTTDPVETFTVTNPAQPFVITGLYGGITYVVNVIDQDFGCNVQGVITINQPLAPLNINVTNFMDEECAEQNLGTIDVSMIGGTAPYAVHYEVVYPGTTTPVIGSTVNLPLGTTTYQFTGLNGGVYTVYVVDANGCSTNVEQTIGSGDNFNPDVVVEAMCYDVVGDPDGLSGVKITVVNTLDPNGNFGAGYTFTLGTYPPQSSPVFESTNPIYGAALLAGGTFQINVLGPNGCSKDTPNFTINPVVPVSVTLVPSPTTINTAIATASGGSGGYTYTFSGVSGDQTSPGVFVYLESGVLTVVATDSSGCSATASLPVTFIPLCIPDVFTPDGNGNNDTWTPGCSEIYPNLKTRIYDRYGRQIAELKEGQTWDGTYEGKELPSGDYWYVIKINGNDDKEYVGHFTLYR
jgi:gliding motility-associated-like protein